MARIDAKPQASLTTLAAALVQFIVCLDTFIINVALPTLITQLHGNAFTAQWTVDAYTLAFASPLLLMGSLTDKFGGRRLFMVGIAGFGLSSLFCALSTSMEMLIVGRAFLGLSAASTVPASMALIKEAYPDEKKRATALGFWMSAGAIAGGVGPLVGGLLTPIDWSLIFTINIPVCLFAFLLTSFLKKSPKVAASFDPLGQVLSTTAIVLLVAGIIEGAEWGYLDPRVLCMFLVGAAGIGLFLFWQTKAKTPMMPLKLFKTRAMRIADFAGFGFIFSWFGVIFISSSYVQNNLGMSALAAGLLFIPASIGAFPCNLIAGPMTAKYGPRRPMMLGFIGAALACGTLAICAFSLETLPYLFLMCALPFVVFGGSITMPAASAVVLENTSQELAGIAGGAFNTFRQVGASMAIAIYGAILSSMAEAPGAAMGTCFVVGTVLNVAVVIACVGLSHKPLK